MMLKVEDMHVYYGAIHAIKGVSFEVGEGEIVEEFIKGYMIKDKVLRHSVVKVAN